MFAMRCQEFDAQIEELLSGVMQPEANEHMRQCDRCTSYFRARTAVQNGLRNLAAAPLPGPSRATDRAVLEAYRRRQLEAAEGMPRPAAHGARLLSFPQRASAAARHSYRWWGSAAAAAVAVAVLGIGLHQVNHSSTAAGPQAVAAAPSAVAASGAVAAEPANAVVAAKSSTEQAVKSAAAAPVALVASGALQAASRRGRKAGNLSGGAVAELASAKAAQPAAAEPVLASASAAQAASGGSPIMHLASTGATAPVTAEGAPPAGSTWPGYSNLMYCDPVVCSGPMPVVHIKVPVQPGAPNAQPGSSDGFVNADVVIGPDGVARAIRVAN